MPASYTDMLDEEGRYVEPASRDIAARNELLEQQNELLRNQLAERNRPATRDERIAQAEQAGDLYTSGHLQAQMLIERTQEQSSSAAEQMQGVVAAGDKRRGSSAPAMAEHQPPSAPEVPSPPQSRGSDEDLAAAARLLGQ